MKKLLLFLICIPVFALSQVGIGTNSPNPSAKLEVSASDKGFLPPRITLSATTDVSTITNPATGLLVYNTATAGSSPNNVTPGFYYFNGSAWVRLITPTDNASNITGTVSVANGGTGLTSITSGQIPFGNGTSSISTDSKLTWDNSASRLNVTGSTWFKTNGSNIGLIFDGYSPSGSLQVSRIYTEATSGTPSDFILGTYPNGHLNQLYLKQSNGFVGIGTSSPGSKLDINGVLRLSGSSSGYVGLAPAAAAGSTTYTLPSADGTNGQFLKTNGSGILSWVSDGGATNINGLSDAKVEDGSIYLGHKPTTTSTAENNISLGTTALKSITTGDNNIAVGKDALYTNTSGTNNIAIGESSLYFHESGANNLGLGVRSQFWNKTGSNNTSVGLYSMYGGINLATGGDNTAVGANSLQAYTSGYSNVAIGMEALNKNTSGAENTAVGKSALFSNTSNADNTAVGASALYYSTGVKNTAVGKSALLNTSTGGLNTALGHAAGDLITTGNHNVIIGAGADPSSNAAANQIVIGYNAVGAGDNTVQLGNTFVTNVNTSGTVTAGGFIKSGGTASQFLMANGSATSSPSLSNATSLPLTTGVTGTLPVANGGTGAATTASALTNLGFATATYISAQKTITQSIANATSTILTNYTNDLAINAGEWDAAAGVFTATKTGIYAVSGTIQLESITSASPFEVSLSIYKNTSLVSIGRFFTNGTWSQFPHSVVTNAIVMLNANDKIDLRVWQNSGTSYNTYSNGTSLTIQELPQKLLR
jgi:hypothetical protein